jgi:hypothetical protein
MFRDLESGNEAFVIVRSDSDKVGLCLSIKSNGDIEVTMTQKDARRLLEALRQAVT